MLSNGPRVLSASGDVMSSTVRGILPLSPLLSPTAQSAFVLDDLRTGTLVSLAQLCDDDCIAIFSRYDVKILKHNNVLITGLRTPNGLWSIPLHVPVHQANGILRLDSSREQLAVYHHTTLGSPAPSTLLRAIRRGHLTTFPGLTTHLISKHLPKSIATTLGHQDQEAKNIRSTRPLSQPTDSVSEPNDDVAPFLEPRSHRVSVALLDHQTLLKSYFDQTGRFHVPSSRGNNYLFILYHQDTNSIHAVAIPNRKAASIRSAWEQTHKLLLHQGHPPTLHILDNECSQDLKDAFAKYHIQFQRVPPRSIVSTLLNVPFGLSKITSFPYSARSTRSYPSPNGTVSFLKPL